MKVKGLDVLTWRLGVSFPLGIELTGLTVVSGENANADHHGTVGLTPTKRPLLFPLPETE